MNDKKYYCNGKKSNSDKIEVGNVLHPINVQLPLSLAKHMTVAVTNVAN